MGILLGGNIRVGFEDNIYLGRGVLASSNAQVVEMAVDLAERLGRQVATPREARQILGLKTLR
jgi:3-keto-5-aminohexanoate cleavage enzyme